MVLKIVSAAYQTFFPTKYAPHIFTGLVATIILRALSQGRTTSRDRDLHARTIIVTGGFTPVGLTILQSLAERGAHIIALTEEPIDSPSVTIIISLLRTTFNNEQIFAEQCDLSSPSSIRSFCTKFLTGQETRIDAIIYAHEYQQIGSVGLLSSRSTREEIQEKRESSSLATFLITTLLLPALLVAPVERDIRIITVVNPFYAAAAGPSFTVPFASSSEKPKPLFLEEGIRALRTSIFTRHLQRIMDALPAAQVPKTDDASSAIPVVSSKAQRSNIVAVSVSPGISRQDTISPLLNADWTSPTGFSWFGVLLYILLQPFLRILTKAPTAAVQTVLHALFLPTPFKLITIPKEEAKPSNRKDAGDSSSPPAASRDPTIRQEVLKPGALYAECAVVNSLRIPSPPDPLLDEEKKDKKGKGKKKEEGMANIPDDGEFGGEVMGRLVWEAYEAALKDWETRNPNPVKEEPKETKKAAATEEEKSPY